MNRTLDSFGDSATDDLDDVVRAVARAPSGVPPREPFPGTRWGAAGRYLIGRRLGAGGTGTVYAATDTLLGRPVALKLLNRGPSIDANANRARVLREARFAAQVEHQRIARVYDVGQDEGSLFVAMEFVRGSTLRSRMGGRAAANDVLTIATQIAEGLAELHARGVIHRDLKPENVMLSEQGDIKLLDFGLARNQSPGTDATASPSAIEPLQIGESVLGFSGTPGYVAPERYEGRPLDPRVDVFALGVIVYELVTGSRPFGSDRPADVRPGSRMTPSFSQVSWNLVPSELRDITGRMLASDPDARFADGAEVLRVLRDIDSRKTGFPEAPVRPARVRRAGFLGYAVACALVAGAAASVALRPQPPAPGEATVSVTAPSFSESPASVEDVFTARTEVPASAAEPVPQQAPSAVASTPGSARRAGLRGPPPGRGVAASSVTSTAEFSQAASPLMGDNGAPILPP